MIIVRGSALPELDCSLTNSLIDDKDNRSVDFDGTVHVCVHILKELRVLTRIVNSEVIIVDMAVPRHALALKLKVKYQCTAGVGMHVCMTA